jgi:hypothetical protein
MQKSGTVCFGMDVARVIAPALNFRSKAWWGIFCW